MSPNDTPATSGKKPPRNSADETSDRGTRKVIGPIWIEAGPAFSAESRLKIRGINARLAAEGAPGRRQVRLSLDEDLVDEVRHLFPGSLSNAVNYLLRRSLKTQLLDEVVSDMEERAGPASPEAYERVLKHWTSSE